jgi:hypothetical protein
MCARFGYRWHACEHCLVLATCVTPTSLRPLITVGNLGVVMLRYCLSLGVFLCS